MTKKQLTTTTTLNKTVTCYACCGDLSNDDYESFYYCPYCGRKIVEGDNND